MFIVIIILNLHILITRLIYNYIIKKKKNNYIILWKTQQHQTPKINS